MKTSTTPNATSEKPKSCTILAAKHLLIHYFASCQDPTPQHVFCGKMIQLLRLPSDTSRSAVVTQYVYFGVDVRFLQWFIFFVFLLSHLDMCLVGGEEQHHWHGKAQQDDPFDFVSPTLANDSALLRHPKLLRLARGDQQNPSMFIAIGSAPKKDALRDTVRSTWLTACKPPRCEYRFFTDANVTLNDKLGGEKNSATGIPADIVTTPSDESGYAHFGIRALLQMEWSLRNVDFDHYLRLDDDGLLCLDHVFHDLKQLPLNRLFWGKYWCQHMVRLFVLYVKHLRIPSHKRQCFGFPTGPHG